MRYGIVRNGKTYTIVTGQSVQECRDKAREQLGEYISGSEDQAKAELLKNKLQALANQ